MLRTKYLGKVSIGDDEFEGKTNLLRGRVAATLFSTRHYSLHQRLVDAAAIDSLHHCEVFEVVMRLEERVSGEELHQDTSNTPDVAREAPAEIQYDFGGPVVAC